MAMFRLADDMRIMGVGILTAEDAPAARAVGSWREFMMREHMAIQGRLPNLDIHQARGVVLADVNGGHWDVACPFCGNRTWAHETLPFLCVTCGNKKNGLRPMVVKYPVMRRVIEEVLLRRPVTASRSWVVGEGVYDLIRENRRHGIS